MKDCKVTQPNDSHGHKGVASNRSSGFEVTSLEAQFKQLQSDFESYKKEMSKTLEEYKEELLKNSPVTQVSSKSKSYNGTTWAELDLDDEGNYTCPYTGWMLLRLTAGYWGSAANIYVNNIAVCTSGKSTVGANSDSVFMPCKVGDKISVDKSKTPSNTFTIRFYYN